MENYPFNSFLSGALKKLFKICSSLKGFFLLKSCSLEKGGKKAKPELLPSKMYSLTVKHQR